jgi:glycosyltransferase involved in cell wall biosynthesis
MSEVEARGAGCIIESDRRAIAAALKSLVKKDEAELKLMSDKARQLAAELYDWSKLIPRYQDMYRRAKSEPRP